jgi:hypothetical protein
MKFLRSSRVRVFQQPQAIALKPQSCPVHPGQELGARTDRLQLVLPQAAQLFLPHSAFVQKFPEHVCESRIPIVILAVETMRASAKAAESNFDRSGPGRNNTVLDADNEPMFNNSQLQP